MINARAVACLACPVAARLSKDKTELLEAANAVLEAYMPMFNDSRAVDDCLVQLALAVTNAEK